MSNVLVKIGEQVIDGHVITEWAEATCEMEDLPNCTGENVTRRVNAYNQALHSDDTEYFICDGCDEHLKYLVATDGQCRGCAGTCCTGEGSEPCTCE
jgi:hypothetical protein